MSRVCIRKNINFQRFGHGFYFAPNSSKCHDYTQGTYTYRVMLQVDILPGKKHNITNSEVLTCPPDGYHSVYRTPGQELNPELVVYNPDSVMPRYIIVYVREGVHRIAKWIIVCNMHSKSSLLSVDVWSLKFPVFLGTGPAAVAADNSTIKLLGVWTPRKRASSLVHGLHSTSWWNTCEKGVCSCRGESGSHTQEQCMIIMVMHLATFVFTGLAHGSMRWLNHHHLPCGYIVDWGNVWLKELICWWLLTHCTQRVFNFNTISCDSYGRRPLHGSWVYSRSTRSLSSCWGHLRCTCHSRSLCSCSGPAPRCGRGRRAGGRSTHTRVRRCPPLPSCTRNTRSCYTCPAGYPGCLSWLHTIPFPLALLNYYT